MFVNINQNDRIIRIQVADVKMQNAVAKEIDLVPNNSIKSIVVLKEIVYLAFHLRMRMIKERFGSIFTASLLNIKDYVYCRMFGKVL